MMMMMEAEVGVETGVGNGERGDAAIGSLCLIRRGSPVTKTTPAEVKNRQ
jgi:hypothetical protein